MEIRPRRSVRKDGEVPRPEALAGTVPAETALVEGFRLAFYGAAGIAACGVVISVLLIGRKKTGT